MIGDVARDTNVTGAGAFIREKRAERAIVFIIWRQS